MKYDELSLVKMTDKLEKNSWTGPNITGPQYTSLKSSPKVTGILLDTGPVIIWIITVLVRILDRGLRSDSLLHQPISVLKSYILHSSRTWQNLHLKHESKIGNKWLWIYYIHLYCHEAHKLLPSSWKPPFNHQLFTKTQITEWPIWKLTT